MRRYDSYTMSVLCLVALGIGSPAGGSEIFHWVDENGVVTFSDWAPENTNLEVTKVAVANSNPPDYDPDEDPNSILLQAERTNERWQELNEQKDERREERIERQQADRYEAPFDYDYPYFVNSPYFLRPIRPPGFRPVRPFKTQARQAIALDRLGLLGSDRAHSINSSAHLQRVNAGKDLLQVIQRPHRPAKHRRSPTGTDR